MINFLSCFVALPVLVLAPVAKADSVNFTLSDPAQSGMPETTFTYVGTIVAPSTNTGDVYLNGDSFNVGGGLTVNDSPYIKNFPFFLTPGQSVTDVVFNVDSDASSVEGVNLGCFELLGGADGAFQPGAAGERSHGWDRDVAAPAWADAGLLKRAAAAVCL